MTPTPKCCNECLSLGTDAVGLGGCINSSCKCHTVQWEKEFDNEFCQFILAWNKYALDIPKDYIPTPDELKSFIAKLLSSQKAEILAVLEGMIGKYLEGLTPNECSVHDYALVEAMVRIKGDNK